ncbi:iron ABC transporter permease [Aliikangiella marina]|uniref:Iron ABC transporter permease n=1 Tax=Aliikangiella marina TaxID=1712262 RepID=A0A545TDA5_9GAMM|nr:iron ABC transporter permease [Aliikangiella marina]TQV75171.1 iron ABC transporter permease [Aliikangiella marina]
MIAAVDYFAHRKQNSLRWQSLFAVLVFTFAIITLGFGPAGWDWRLAFAWLLPEHFTQFSELQLNVVTHIRLPRFCLALIVGAVLAQTGAATQALCRNPLADPSIIGVSAGAAVMAVAVIALAPKIGFNPDVWLPYAAFSGALLVTFLVYHMAQQNQEISVTSLILVGVALNALSFALIGLFSFYADDSSLRLINYWTMGSLAGAGWSGLLQSLPLILMSFVGLYSKRAELNLLLLGESEARYLGVNIQRLKMQIVIYVALGVGAVVAMTGMIGFVGLVVPHMTRLLVGANMRYMLSVCALLGSVVLLFSDWLAKIVVAPTELPIGIITALIGAPVFIYLLQKNRMRGHHA